MIGMVKKNTKVFCKDTIDNLTKDWLGGSYLVLKRKYVVIVDRPITDIGYKYDTLKILYLISTEYTGITKEGIPYLYNYPGQFSNISIHPIACTLVMSKFFGYVD